MAAHSEDQSTPQLSTLYLLLAEGLPRTKKVGQGGYNVPCDGDIFSCYYDVKHLQVTLNPEP